MALGYIAGHSDQFAMAVIGSMVQKNEANLEHILHILNTCVKCAVLYIIYLNILYNCRSVLFNWL